MKENNKNYFTVLVILLTCTLLVFKIEYAGTNIEHSAKLDGLPLTIGEWQGRDIAVEEHVYEILGTRDVIVRDYTDGSGNALALTVVYSRGNRDSFHPPEYCYIGGGVELLGKGKENIMLDSAELFKVNKLIMGDNYGKILAWYWYSAGNRFVDKYYLQQAYFLLDAIRGNGLGGALVRVSIREKDENSALKAKEFMAQAVGILKEVL